MNPKITEIRTLLPPAYTAADKKLTASKFRSATWTDERLRQRIEEGAKTMASALDTMMLAQAELDRRAKLAGA